MRSLSLLLCAVAACSGSSSEAPPDAAPPDADLARLSCVDLQAFARGRVAVLGLIATCDCTPTLTGESCEVPANAAAVTADAELGRAAQLVYQTCHSCSGGVGGICDCAPSAVAASTGPTRAERQGDST